jgi:hypothetical protein
MRFFSLLFLASQLLWAASCSFSQPIIERGVPRPEDIPLPSEIVDSAEMTCIIQDVTTAWKYDKHLHLEHANTYYKEGIHTVQLQFISQDIIEMCEARDLIVSITEEILARINQSPIAGPDLSNYPFQPSNLEIYITFESYYGKYCDPHYIAWIGMEDAVITFYTFDLLDHMKSCWHRRVETYPTSREIVMCQREAEKKYNESHLKNVNVFGSQRYYPPGQAHKDAFPQR